MMENGLGSCTCRISNKSSAAHGLVAKDGWFWLLCRPTSGCLHCCGVKYHNDLIHTLQEHALVALLM